MKTHFSAQVVIYLHPPFDYNNKPNHEHSENHRDPHNTQPLITTPVCACACATTTTSRREWLSLGSLVHYRARGAEGREAGEQKGGDLDARSSYLKHLHKGGRKIYASDLEIEIVSE